MPGRLAEPDLCGAFPGQGGQAGPRRGARRHRTPRNSPLSALARSTPLETFHDWCDSAKAWRAAPSATVLGPLAGRRGKIHALLQSDLPLNSPRFLAQAALFRAWSARPLDLPGAYYLEVVEKLYKETAGAGRIRRPRQAARPSRLRQPLYPVAARDDEVAAPEQTFACADLLGTPPGQVVRRLVDGEHLSLFMGARNLRELWPEVIAWLGNDANAKGPKRRARGVQRDI